MNHNTDPLYTGTRLDSPKYFKSMQDMPTKEELLKRNSFGSVNDNKYLDKMIKDKRNANSRLRAAAKRLDDMGANPTQVEVDSLVDLIREV